MAQKPCCCCWPVANTTAPPLGRSSCQTQFPLSCQNMAVRRKTLSGMDASLLNTRVHGDLAGGRGSDTDFRKSVGGASFGDVSVAAKHASLSKRPQSRIHQVKPSSSRRYSMYFSSGHTPRADPRPLGDKTYSSSCVRQLISFLSSHWFDSVLAPKALAAPTTKDFRAVSLFLFRRADRNFKFGSKTEDDVPTVFKQLRYPFQISKSALYAVGSPHTWPSLLAALTWLVQIYLYEEAQQNNAKVKSLSYFILAPQNSVLTYDTYSACAWRTCKIFLHVREHRVSGK